MWQDTSWKSPVMSYELLVRIRKCESTSLNSNLRLQIHELRVELYEFRVQIHKLRVEIHESRVQIHDLRVQIYEFKNQRNLR